MEQIHRLESWEVVLPKKSGKTEPLTKAKKKVLAEKMPTIEPSAPVEESKTIYDTFLKEEERKEKRAKALEEAQNINKHPGVMSGGGGGGGGGKKGGPQGKKGGEKVGGVGGDKKKEKPVKLEDAIAQIDAADLERLLGEVQHRFPDSPDVWLKDLASLVNLLLDKVTDIDPVSITGKTADYPKCLLSKRVGDFLLSTVKSSSPKTLSSFLEFCIDQMLTDQTKDIPTHGYRLFVQIVLSSRPETVVGALEKYIALLQQNVSRPRRALTILWSVGQVGLYNLTCGLKVWLGVMLPVMNVRSLSEYSVQYLESLLRRYSTDLKSGHAGLSKKDFFKLFDELYSSQPSSSAPSASPSLSTDLRKRLLTLYPQLKVIVSGEPSSQHNLFSSFLSRLTNDCPNSKKNELLSCLVRCLEVDNQSFSVWRQVYTKHLAQSSVLLDHLLSESVLLNINRDLLRETVRAFHVTNDDLANDNTTSASNAQYLRASVKSCNELLVRLSGPRFPWKRLIFIALFLLVALFLCDSYISGGVYMYVIAATTAVYLIVTESWSYRTLDGIGAITFLQQTWTRISFYGVKTYMWLADNTPYYYHKTVDIISPYALLAWEKVGVAAVTLVTWLRPLQQRFLAFVPVVQQWLETTLPSVLDFISLYLSSAFTMMITGATWLFTNIYNFYIIARDWLLVNILVGCLSPENISLTLSSLLASLQSYVLRFYAWCGSFIN